MIMGYVGVDNNQICLECLARLLVHEKGQFNKDVAASRHAFGRYSTLELITIFEEWDDTCV